jgi:hypothetical protein
MVAPWMALHGEFILPVVNFGGLTWIVQTPMEILDLSKAITTRSLQLSRFPVMRAVPLLQSPTPDVMIIRDAVSLLASSVTESLLETG